MKPNTQKAEGLLFRSGRHLLEVHSIFLTLQGEGPFAGNPAIFIRLAGCNLQCPKCDTDYTSTRESYTPIDVVNVLSTLIATHRLHYKPLIVITGGEPFRQELMPLCQTLQANHFEDIQIECNGTLYNPIPDAVTVVVSPKLAGINKVFTTRKNTYFKYVVDPAFVDPYDGLPTEVLGLGLNGGKVARPPEGATVYVQPIDTHYDYHNKVNLPKMVALTIKYGYTLSLQLHKLLNLE